MEFALHAISPGVEPTGRALAGRSQLGRDVGLYRAVAEAFEQARVPTVTACGSSGPGEIEALQEGLGPETAPLWGQDALVHETR
jgi:hypothetical protein